MSDGVALSFHDIWALQDKELVCGSFQKQEYFLLFPCIFDLPSPGSIPIKQSLSFFFFCPAECAFSWFSLQTGANHEKQIGEKNLLIPKWGRWDQVFICCTLPYVQRLGLGATQEGILPLPFDPVTVEPIIVWKRNIQEQLW